MEPELQEALAELLPDTPRGDLIDDLCLAARESMRRREVNSRNGGVVIAALRREGLSWREIERRTGISRTTAQRWAELPPKP